MRLPTGGAAVGLVICAVLAGCAMPQSATSFAANSPSFAEGSKIYRGRLALKVEPEVATDSGPPKGQSFSAGFELAGSAQSGSLSLTNPLGNLLAILNWTNSTAELRANGAKQSFASLDALVKHVTGTGVPVEGLFNWLAGRDAVVAEWEADLSQISNGRLTARRNLPNKAELKIVLEL